MRSILWAFLQCSMTSVEVGLEPACGVGHMVKVLAEYFGQVKSADIHDYAYGDVRDFLKGPLAVDSLDWVVTNPPFRLAEEFVQRALQIARKGVAILARTVFIESVGRHERLFQVHPPAKFAQFTERVPMVKGRLDRKASTATGYGWLVWEKGHTGGTQLVWIPQCRKALERDGDYELPPRPPVAVNPPVARKKRVRASGVSQESLFGL
jgi:hypothetical protein